MTLDLDALALAVSAMTPGTWAADTAGYSTDNPGGFKDADDSDLHPDDVGICALRNHAAELIRLARIGAGHDARVTELLAANTAEVFRRRAAEAAAQPQGASSETEYDCMIISADMPAGAVQFYAPREFPLCGGMFAIRRLRSVTAEDKVRLAEADRQSEVQADG